MENPAGSRGGEEDWARGHWHGRPLGASGAARRLVHAGMDGEDLDQAGDGQDPQHLLLRRG
jgi:hypothetical protein